ncbi:hypothetical protein LXL04_006018 [Taraxacum kok-saghyz]
MNNFIIRPSKEVTSPEILYGEENKQFITIRLIHGGRFSSRAMAKRMYHPRRITFIEFVDISLLSRELLQEIISNLGYKEQGFFFRKDPNEDLDYGLRSMQLVYDFQEFHADVYPRFCNLIYTFYLEIGTPTINVSYPLSLRYACPEKICDMLMDFVYDNPLCSLEDASLYLLSKYSVRIRDSRIIPGLRIASERVGFVDDIRNFYFI